MKKQAKDSTSSDYLDDDANYISFKNRLQSMGLDIRGIPGDGNCLFRALGDQLDGHSHHHLKHRQEVVQYLKEHREDFEPFVEDDIPFDRHIAMLSKDGTFAGNDAIVAFARKHRVNVVIHQYNRPLWQIHGSDKAGARQLHISFHNGNHYSSVRRLGDNSSEPAMIKLDAAETSGRRQQGSQKGKQQKETLHHSARRSQRSHPRDTNGVSGAFDPESDNLTDQELQIMDITGCESLELIREALEDAGYDTTSAANIILQLTEDTPELDSSEGGTSIWAHNGSGTRIFGNPDPKSAKGQGARPKLKKSQTGHLSNRQRQQLVRKERKKSREERRHNKPSQDGGGGDLTDDSDETNSSVLVHNMGMLRI